ncbi:glycosyltransferase family A protein [Faecalibacter sp. LW9]|uniref:glycosyltransferase family 2 protein n=1 Tax=Faecalibacter sp. LW9 TaxID=3103144 RepID=UPI002B003275|nr:glycosyltransferase family A protein [Faecalibacter sp. LW9]
MENQIRVSVVMTVYNAANYLSLAIESILNQTYKNFEFLIIDDCSKDDSLQIITKYSSVDPRIVVIKNNINQGVSKSCNYAIKEVAKGDIIIRMDSDDIAKTKRIEVLVDYLDRYPEIVALGSNADFIDMEGEYIFTSKLPLKHDDIIRSLEKRATFINPTTAFRKNAFLKVGGYYEPIKHYFEDYMLWWQLSKIGKMEILNASLMCYRIVMNSISSKEISPEYKLLEQKIVKKGFATEEEINFIFKEKSIKSNPKNSELAYYLILAQKYLIDNYNLPLAKKNLSRARQINPSSKKLILLTLISWLPQKMIQLMIKTLKS